MNGSRADQPWFELIGRIFIGGLFVVYGVLQIYKFGFYIGYMTRFGVPLPEIGLVLSIILEVGGGLMIACGWKMRWAALVLAIWVLVVTFFFHRFWEFDEAQAANQMAHFFKNFGISGALLYLFFHGAGPLSLDARENKTAT